MDTDNAATDNGATDIAATVIIGQRVRPGCEQAFIKWQHGLNDVASHYPGFIGAEVDRAHCGAAGVGCGLPLRLHRQRCGVDRTARHAKIVSQQGENTSTVRRPSRFSVVPQSRPMNW